MSPHNTLSSLNQRHMKLIDLKSKSFTAQGVDVREGDGYPLITRGWFNLQSADITSMAVFARFNCSSNSMIWLRKKH